jgi:hypothetical protein
MRGVRLGVWASMIMCVEGWRDGSWKLEGYDDMISRQYKDRVN